MSKKQNPADKQQPHTGKVENDHNKVGEQAATQKNEGKRTPDSRSDREANIRNNEAHMKQGGSKSGNQAAARRPLGVVPRWRGCRRVKWARDPLRTRE